MQRADHLTPPNSAKLLLIPLPLCRRFHQLMMVMSRRPRPMALAALTLFLLVSAFGRATGTDTFCASCTEDEGIAFCFMPDICPHFSGGLWLPPFDFCNDRVYARGKVACASCFSAWQCSGAPASPMAPAHAPPSSFEAALGVVGPSPTPSPAAASAFCASCAYLQRCFKPSLCPYFRHRRWLPPYGRVCNDHVIDRGNAACASCFPEFTCYSKGADSPPTPSPPAPSPPAPSPSAQSATGTLRQSVPTIEPASQGQLLDDPGLTVPASINSPFCPLRCRVLTADRCFGELACVHFDGAWHGPHAHCNAFLACRACFPQTSCGPPLAQLSRDLLPDGDRGALLPDGDRGALEALAAAGAIAEATCRSPEVTCWSDGTPTRSEKKKAGASRVRILNVRATNGTVGQLAWLEPLTALEWLAVPPSFSGSLASLQGLQRLTTLRLRGPGIHGALDALGGCGRLRHLSLANMRLQGSLYDLMPLRALEVVTLHNVSVAGSLAALRGLAGLTTVCLANTGLAGSLAHLRGLANLTTLALVDIPVGGSVAALRALGLRTLALIGTDVEGPLAALGNMTSLRDLTLWRSRVEGPLGALRPLWGLKALSLGHAPRVDADLSAVSDMWDLVELRLQALPLGGSLDALKALRSLRELVLGPHATAPVSARVAGSLASLGQIRDLETLYLEGVAVQGLFWTLHQLPALRYVAVVDSPVAGSLASAAGLSQLVSLEIRDVPLEGTLDSLASLTDLKFLTMRAAGVAGDLRALPQALTWVDVSGNALFAPGGNVSVDLPDCWFVNLSHNGIADGRLGSLRTAATSLVDLLGNDFRCPLAFLPGVTLVTPGCHENMVLFWAMLAVTGVVLVVSLVLMTWFERKAGDGDAKTGPRGVRLRTLGLHLLRLVCLADVATDVLAGGSMLRTTATRADACTPFNEYAQFQALLPRHKSYELPVVLHAPAPAGAAAANRTGAAPDFAAWVRTLEGEGWPASAVEPVVARFASTCRRFRHCEYAEARCRPVAGDPYWWFRLLLILDIAVFGGKELLKVLGLCYYALRGEGPPERLQWFCATSPFAILLCPCFPSIRFLADRLPERRDLAWQVVYDLLLEDIPQLALQVVFLKVITPVGLTFVEFLSMFFTILSLLSITCRCTSKQALYRVTSTVRRTLSVVSGPELVEPPIQFEAWPRAPGAGGTADVKTDTELSTCSSKTCTSTSISLQSPQAASGSARVTAGDAESDPCPAGAEADGGTPESPPPQSRPSGGLPAHADPGPAPATPPPHPNPLAATPPPHPNPLAAVYLEGAAPPIPEEQVDGQGVP